MKIGLSVAMPCPFGCAFETDRDALHRQIAQAPLIPAMLSLRDGPTRWTSWHRVALGRDHPVIFSFADRMDDHRWTGRRILFCAMSDSQCRAATPAAAITESADGGT